MMFESWFTLHPYLTFILGLFLIATISNTIQSIFGFKELKSKERKESKEIKVNEIITENYKDIKVKQSSDPYDPFSH